MNNNTNNNTTLDNIKNIDSHVYFDNAATTRTDDDAAGLALKLMCDVYANPSSAHAFGFEAEKLLKEARQNILRALNVSASDGTLIFTSWRNGVGQHGNTQCCSCPGTQRQAYRNIRFRASGCGKYGERA